jgi:hypothetical protein
MRHGDHTSERRIVYWGLDEVPEQNDDEPEPERLDLPASDLDDVYWQLVGEDRAAAGEHDEPPVYTQWLADHARDRDLRNAHHAARLSDARRARAAARLPRAPRGSRKPRRARVARTARATATGDPAPPASDPADRRRADARPCAGGAS